MSTALQQTLSTLETLAFTLPGPWGPVASAAIHLFGPLIDPTQPEDPAKVVLDAIRDGFNDLKSSGAVANIQEAQNYLTTLDGWLTKVGSRRDLDQITTLETLISAMADLDKPITDLDKVVNKLDVSIPLTNDFLSESQGKISTLVSLRVATISLLNFRVLLQQRLVNRLNESDDPVDQAKVLDQMGFLATYYNSLQTGIDGLTDPAMVTNLKKVCDDVRDSAIRLVQPVTKTGDDPSGFHFIGDAVYSFIDDTGVSHQVPNSYHQVANTVFIGAVPHTTYEWVLSPPDQKATVDSNRATYISNLTRRCNDFRDGQASIFETAQKLRAGTSAAPFPPRTGPTVDYTVDTQWPRAWKNVNKWVRYAVAFVGPSSYVPDPTNKSQMRFSAWLQCTRSDSYCPVITLPVDTNARSRFVLREVASDTAGTNLELRHIPIPNQTHTEFTDLDPVNDDDVCPNVFIPPVLWAANYASNQAGRTWDDPYRVRYRYRLQKTVNGTVYSSIDWSPWSVSPPGTGADVDSKGFLYNPGYYSFQLLVPEPDDPACTFVLQRHFEKDPPPADDDAGIRSGASKAPQSGMMYLCDNEGP